MVEPKCWFTFVLVLNPTVGLFIYLFLTQWLCFSLFDPKMG